MHIRLINLDRSPERLAEFNALNGHLRDLSRFPAVDGSLVTRGDLVKRGLIDPALDYTNGALGNALSHLILWDEAIERNQAITLCEDDAIFNFAFEEQAEALIESLGADWHIIFWGWNFDAFALFDLIPGVSQLLAHFDQAQMRTATDTFQSSVLAPRALRLLAAFGIVCYTISPAGARLLTQLCLPLDNNPIVVPSVNRGFANRDLSVALVAALPKVNAFASFPPLVITNNDHAISTVLPEKR